MKMQKWMSVFGSLALAGMLVGCEPADDTGETEVIIEEGYVPERDPVDQPLIDESATTDPTFNQPTFDDPTATDPTANEPLFGEPAMNEPTANQPAASEPLFGEPATGETALEGEDADPVSESVVEVEDDAEIIENPAQPNNQNQTQPNNQNQQNQQPAGGAADAGQESESEEEQVNEDVTEQ